MKKMSIRRSLIFLICLSFVVAFSACNTVGGKVQVDWGTKKKDQPKRKKSHKKGPPAHAPAHGYRAKHAYRYYPDSYVYLDTQRKVYFYLEGTTWKMTVSLPRELRIGLSNYVTIELETEKPYTRFKDHKKKFPSGKSKKGKKFPKKKKKRS